MCASCVCSHALCIDRSLENPPKPICCLGTTNNSTPTCWSARQHKQCRKSALAMKFAQPYNSRTPRFRRRIGSHCNLCKNRLRYYPMAARSLQRTACKHFDHPSKTQQYKPCSLLSRCCKCGIRLHKARSSQNHLTSIYRQCKSCTLLREPLLRIGLLHTRRTLRRLVRRIDLPSTRRTS